MPFDSQEWGPDSGLTQPRMQLMMDNDVYVKNVVNAKYGYGFYLWEQTTQEADFISDYDDNISVPPGHTSSGFLSSYSLATISVNNVYKFSLWECGVIIPSIEMNPSSIHVANTFPNGDDFANCLTAIHFEDSERNVLGKIVGEPLFDGEYPGWTICGKTIFSLDNTDPGQQDVNFYITGAPAHQTFKMNVASTQPAQIYLLCLGSANVGYTI